MTLIYVGDIGARLTISTNNTTMANTTALTVLLKRPDKTLLTITPSVNFTTGVLTYDTVSGNLSSVGEYTVQVNGVFDDGDVLRSEMSTFYVFEKLS